MVDFLFFEFATKDVAAGFLMKFVSADPDAEYPLFATCLLPAKPCFDGVALDLASSSKVASLIS